VQNLFLRLGDGWGEGAPIYYLNQSAPEMLTLAQEWCTSPPDLERTVEEIVEGVLRRYPGQTAFAQAIDLALHDAWGQAQGKPLHELWSIRWENVPRSSFTIGIDTLEVMLQKVERAQAYPILKVKAGGADDLHVLQAIHDACGKPLYIDANEGWSVAQTLEYLPRLQALNVQVLEQPLPRDDRQGYRQVREQNPTPIPILIDEGVHHPENIPHWADAADGINLKLAKCGGLARARQMIALAREHRLKIMLGCMIESSLGITAAAHLAPLVDYLDLDGAALLADDPFDGMRLDHGRLLMPERPGIGATLR
jgi:L-alanine-DL-glutamate epimerase-like enolase superfamily enzyme